jgi:two-component system sensor histidine kinase VicK
MVKEKSLFSNVDQERIAYRLVLSFALMGIIPMLLTIYLVVVIWLPEMDLWVQISVILLLSLSATILGFLLSRNIVYSILRTAREAKEIANGNLSKRLEVTNDRSELSQLAVSFNKITSQLEQKITALEASERKLKHILDNVPDMLYYLNPDGTISSVNDEVTELLGFSKEELLNEPFSNIVYEKDFDKYKWMLQERRADESRLAKGIRIRLKSKDGNYRSFEINSRGIYDKENAFVGTEGLARDITAQLALENERDEFIYMLSHDIRNPISAILFIIHMLRDGTIGPEKYDAFLDKIENACNGVVRLVEDFLEYKKLELGRVQIEKTRIDLNKKLLEIAHTYSSEAEANGKQITVNGQDCKEAVLREKLIVEVDERYFSRVVENLLTNAIKFAETQVEMELNQDERGIVLSVTDDGAGIPEKEKENVFKLFHTSSGSRTAKGLGVGLASAFKIVMAHGGRIWVEEPQERGCSFVIIIPPGSSAVNTESDAGLKQESVSPTPVKTS